MILKQETHLEKDRRHERAGFTLVELLTAVLIIAALAGILLPAIGAIREAANRKKAHTDTMALDHSIQAYRSRYGVWPTQIAGTQDKVTQDPVVIANILAVLSNNVRGEVYAQFEEGSLSNGCLLDPWRRPYVVGMDEDNDGDVEINISIGSVTLVTNIRARVAVFSWGRYPYEQKRRAYSWIK
jgi:prepilin-type N-terminal cleavage/methylation domain-containing protein